MFSYSLNMGKAKKEKQTNKQTNKQTKKIKKKFLLITIGII